MTTIYYIRWKITGTCFRIEQTAKTPESNPKFYFIKLTQEEHQLIQKLKENTGLLDQFLSFVTQVLITPNVDMYVFGRLYNLLIQNLNHFLQQQDYHLYQKFFERIFIISTKTSN